MITYFLEQDLVSFGTYLLSPDRKKAYVKYGLAEEKIPEAMSVINPLDLTSWVDWLQEQRKLAEKSQQEQQAENGGE